MKIIALALLVLPAVCGANDFTSLAKDLSRSARNAGLSRVSVLPFVPADGSDARGGWDLSERLTTEVVHAGAVRVVERPLLGKILEEERLARTGILDQSSPSALGNVARIEGIITGTFVSSGNETVLNARLIDAETGVVLAAAERAVSRQWPGQADPPAWDARPDPPGMDPSAAAGSPCADADRRIDDLERQVLDLKARYWAARLKQESAAARPQADPGSTISDPALKKAFHDRVDFWSEAARIPSLTATEIERFVSIDGRAYSLYRACRA